MGFFDLFDLDPHRVVDFLAKLGINVSEGTVDTVITFLILLASKRSVKAVLSA